MSKYTNVRNALVDLACVAKNAANKRVGDYTGKKKMSKSEFQMEVERTRKDFPWFFIGNPDAESYDYYLKQWAKENE